jgi:DNA-binding CsgD family transcriptional regulator
MRSSTGAAECDALTQGGAANPSCLDELPCGVRAIGVARSRPAGADPAESIERWPSLVADRWSLVDDVEGGRSFILAVENGAKPASIGLLSPREREVVLRALRGQPNKSIAYDMGLAQSTVRVLVARAATKVGASSRRQLLEMVARLGPRFT